MYNVKALQQDFQGRSERSGCCEIYLLRRTSNPDYDAVLIRSAKLHEVEFPKDLKCIARAGAGVNNIPIDRCSEEGHRSLQHAGCKR